MKLIPTVPKRKFQVGGKKTITINDCAKIMLEPNEQVTFVTESGSEHDVVRKSWGFYATGSTNARLPKHGLRPLLSRNTSGQFYLLIVERGKESELAEYLASETMEIILWLDGSESIEHLSRYNEFR